jgi:hypothetical protein
MQGLFKSRASMKILERLRLVAGDHVMSYYCFSLPSKTPWDMARYYNENHCFLKSYLYMELHFFVIKPVRAARFGSPLGPCSSRCA